MLSFPTSRFDEPYREYWHRAQGAMFDWVERAIATLAARAHAIGAPAPTDPAAVRAAIGPLADDEIGRACRPFECRLLDAKIRDVLTARAAIAQHEANVAAGVTAEGAAL